MIYEPNIYQGWFIKPTYQNRGLGSLWVSYILNNCRENDIKHLQLTVDKTNTRAIGLYTARGFNRSLSSDFVAAPRTPPIG